MPTPTTDLSLLTSSSWLDMGNTDYMYDTGINCSDNADTGAHYSRLDHTYRVSQSDTGKPALVKKFSDYVPEVAVPTVQAQEAQPQGIVVSLLPDLSDPSTQFMFGALLVASGINAVSVFKFDNTSLFTWMSISFTVPYFCCCGADLCCGSFAQVGLALLGLFFSSNNPPKPATES
jgi:hypothetical protein